MIATAATKSLQSCLTLYNPIDRSPPGSSVPGILQARTWLGEDKMYTEMHVYSYVHPYFTEVVNFWQCQMPQLTLFYDRLKIKKQCNVWKVKVLVTQLCPTLFNPLYCSPPGSFVHGILQARILRWVAYPFSRGSSQPRDQTWVSYTAGRFFTIWATWEAQGNVYVYQIPILYTMHILQFYVNYASVNHVWMWGLGCEESWVMKNWCFWTVVLEKTLESPLDCKEIQPVHPKGDQSCVFIGRTDAEAETPILWPPDAKNWLIGKDPDAGKDWDQEENRMTENDMVWWHHWLNVHESEQALGVGDVQGSLTCCSPWGHRVKHD